MLQETLKEMVKDMLGKFGTQRYIANLGSGIPVDADPEQLKVFVDAVHRISEEMIAAKQ